MRETLIKWLYRVEQNKVLVAVEKSLITLIPVILMGSIALLLQSFPVTAYQDFLSKVLYGVPSLLLDIISQSTFGVISVYLLCVLSYHYSAELDADAAEMRAMSAAASFACFIVSFGGVNNGLTLTDFGTNGVFTAMVCAVVGTHLFHRFDKKFGRGKIAYVGGADVYFQNAVNRGLPFAATLLVFVCFYLMIRFIFGVGNFNELIAQTMYSLFAHPHAELASGMLYTFLLQALWFFGIHGGNVLAQAASTVFVTDGTQIISKTFLDSFVMMGGCGATLSLLLALLLFSHTKNDHRLALTATPFAIFNMNEILLFGLPVVLNPFFIIPFLLAPIAALLISYFATMIGFLPVTDTNMAWTTPVFVSGYLAAGSLRGTVVQFVSLISGTLLYAPFVRLSERSQQKREELLLAEMTELLKKSEENQEKLLFLSRHDRMGALAKAMVEQLRIDVEAERIRLYYQPQVRVDGTIAGAEALLRWKYHDQMVYPPLIISLATENKLFDQMTSLIVQTAARDAHAALEVGVLENVSISVNIAAGQLSNPEFIDKVIALVQDKHLCGHFCLEVTENTALDHLERIVENVGRLRENGIFTAIDDFSMGHTSLKYLQSNCFRYVKLDGGIVRQVRENPRCRDIISSITALGERLDFEVIAEYVETEALQTELIALGCLYFQGYLHSPALPLGEFILYCRRKDQSMAAHTKAMVEGAAT